MCSDKKSGQPERRKGLAVCFVHVCAGVLCINLGENKGTALC